MPGSSLVIEIFDCVGDRKLIYFLRFSIVKYFGYRHEYAMILLISATCVVAAKKPFAQMPIQMGFGIQMRQVYRGST